MATKTVPTLRLRLGGHIVMLQVPGTTRPPMGDRTNGLAPASSSRSSGAHAEAADDDMPGLVEDDEDEAAMIDAIENELGALFEDDDDDPDAEDDDDDPDAEDEEDAPEWVFETGEKVSKDKTYVFTPAPHRQQLLRIVARTFRHHPIFHMANEEFADAKAIRQRTVYKMYLFCHARGLTEMWAYFWANWYSPS